MLKERRPSRKDISLPEKGGQIYEKEMRKEREKKEKSGPKFFQLTANGFGAMVRRFLKAFFVPGGK
jgi:hypothetical protein